MKWMLIKAKNSLGKQRLIQKINSETHLYSLKPEAGEENACGEVDIYWCSRCFLLPNICAWWPIALVALSAGHFRYNLSSCASDNPWRKYWDNWDPIVPNEKLSSCQLCNIPKSFQMRLKSLTFVVWGYLAILWTSRFLALRQQLPKALFADQ